MIVPNTSHQALRLAGGGTRRHPACHTGAAPGLLLEAPFSAYDDASGSHAYGSAINPQVFVVDAETGVIERAGRPSPEERHFFEADPCWSLDGRALTYSVIPTGPPARDASAYVRRVDLSTGQLTRVPGSEGLWSPKCTPDGRIIAFDGLAPRAHEQQGGAGRREFFKLWRPSTREWSAFSVDLATWAYLNYPTWSRDGRFVYATAQGADAPVQAIVRFAVETRRLETIARVDGLRADIWMNLTPDGVLLVHRDASRHEIVVMDWEVR